MLRYLKVFLIQFKFNILKDLSFRFSFIFSILGAACFVALYYFTFYLLLANFSLVGWSYYEMWIMLGCFIVVIYGFFMLFYKPLILYTDALHTGMLDIFLLKPIDTQFLFASAGGSIRNLIALLFGLILVYFGAEKTNNPISLLTVLGVLIAMILSMINLFSFIFGLLTLGFRLGYTDGLVVLVIKFQDFMKFPVDAFKHIPIYLLLFAVPFSLLTTSPVYILLNRPYALIEFISYVICSLLFIIFVRAILRYLLRDYSSGS